MSRMTPEQIAHAKRATERARKTLKVGDLLTVRRCADVKINVTMRGWEGDWICSAKYSDIHALHIERVNGRPASFHDQADKP